MPPNQKEKPGQVCACQPALGQRQRQGKLDDLRTDSRFILWMALESILGALTGSALLRFAPSALLHILLGIILLVSAVKLLRDHSRGATMIYANPALQLPLRLSLCFGGS